MRVWTLHAWMRRGAVTLLIGTVLAALSGCSHNPNHGVDMDQARAAAQRIHPAPPPGVKVVPGAGG
ncbi:MAG: hypothetical protein LC772_00115 [Chloroflexi bacterium]|nr:hypothetical protein [Chloroflexota bacterium]